MVDKFRFRAWVNSLKKHKPVTCIDFLLDEIEVVEWVGGQHKALRFDIDDVILEQCAGLTATKSYRGESENDRLVFEGDIIQINGYSYYEPEIDEFGEVIYTTHGPDITKRDKTTALFSNLQGSYYTEYEIVGNVHEHPELLEVQ